MNAFANETVCAVRWDEGGVVMLDQRALPQQEIYLELHHAAAVTAAIRDMAVRGAPAIGVSAAYAVVLAAREAWMSAGDAWRDAIAPALTALADARPTAINLHWAIERMRATFHAIDGNPEPDLLAEALAIHHEDVAANQAMARAGAARLGTACAVLTHCNTGALATGGVGTALGVIRAAHAERRLRAVFACEARPWLQGARLTAWELEKEGIPFRLIADSAAALTIERERVDWVIVGADRIAFNGDVANKIGTWNLALIARALGARMMVVAPTSTFDPDCPDGDSIPIEQRPEEELLELGGQRIAAPGTRANNPVFDVTKAHYIDCIVTERGVFDNPAERPPGEILKSLDQSG